MSAGGTFTRSARAKAPRFFALATHSGRAKPVSPSWQSQAPRPAPLRSSTIRPFAPTTTRTSVAVPALTRHPMQVRVGSTVA